MGIYIDNIEMPKGHGYLTINIWSNGTTSYGLFDRKGNLCTFKGAKAISVPSHGDLIDKDQAINALWKTLYNYEDITEKQFIDNPDLDISDWILYRIFVQNMNDADRQIVSLLPAIIPADKPKEKET